MNDKMSATDVLNPEHVEMAAYEAENDLLLEKIRQTCRGVESEDECRQALDALADRWFYIPGEGDKRWRDCTTDDLDLFADMYADVAEYRVQNLRAVVRLSEALEAHGLRLRVQGELVGCGAKRQPE